MKEQLIGQAERLFYQFGVRAVRVDNIAHELGFARKTRYQYVTSKEELTKLVLTGQLTLMLRQQDTTSKDVANPLQHAFQIWDLLEHYRQVVNPNFERDIQRYYTETWTIYQNLKDEFINQTLVLNIRAGVMQGVYRSDIQEQVIA